MKRLTKPEPVHYADLRAVIFRAAERFPENRFFRCGDPVMPYVTGSALKSYCGAFGARSERLGDTGMHIAILGPNGAAKASRAGSAEGATRTVCSSPHWRQDSRTAHSRASNAPSAGAEGSGRW